MSTHLAKRTTRGFLYMFGQTLASKVVSLVGQLVLAYLLAPAAFGLFATAMAITALTAVIQEIGLREILIRKRRAFNRWASSAVWLSLTLGAVAGTALLVASPFLADLKGDPRLLPMLVVLAASIPFWGGALPFAAAIERDLRFTLSANAQFGFATLLIVLQVILAWMGMGPLAFVLPRLIVGVVRFMTLWKLSGVRVRPRPELRLWRFFARDGIPLTFSTLLDIVVRQADYLILGFFANDAVVGFYFFAYNQSTQVAQLLMLNLTRVLLPSLSTLSHDAVRQVRAFLKAISVLALVCTPLCVLQGALAGPVLRLLYQDRWADSIPLLQILSVALAIAIVGWPSASLLLAQGRYKTKLLLSAIGAACFVAFVTLGSWLGGAVGTALGVMAYRVTLDPIRLYVATRPGSVHFIRVVPVFMTPLTGSILTIGAGWLAAEQIPDSILQHAWLVEVVRIAATCAVGLPLYLLWARFVSASEWRELMARLRTAAPARFADRIPAWLD
ncbi:MAG: oligosaccharide flippase family protein [Phycisphaerales bacterium]